jgi:lipoprotein-releasing system permease protein
MSATVEAAAAPSAKATRPFAPFEWMVAFRYLRARNAQKSISVIAGFSFLGIVLGVAALIVVMSVMNGFRHDLMEKMIGLNGHMFLQGVETPLTDYEAVTERVGKVPGVTLALPLVEGQAFASSPYGSSGALVRGIRGQDFERLPGIAGHITQGSLGGFDEGQGVAVGSKLAERLSLRVGDKLTIMSPHGAETPFGVTPRMKAYTVAAIFQIGMATLDNSFIFMPLAEAQTFFNYDGQANVIEVYVADPDDMDAMRRAIEPAQQRPMIDTDWRQLNRSFFDVLAVESNVMFAILALIMLVAALNIISGLIMLVQDKARAVAVLRTMGATRGAVMRIFLITGATIGVVGTVVGLVLGLLVAYNVEPIRRGLAWLTGANLFPAEFYFLSQLPSRVEPKDVLAVVGLALFLSIAATIYPSWRAAKLDPVEALRYE